MRTFVVKMSAKNDADINEDEEDDEEMETEKAKIAKPAKPPAPPKQPAGNPVTRSFLPFFKIQWRFAVAGPAPETFGTAVGVIIPPPELKGKHKHTHSHSNTQTKRFHTTHEHFHSRAVYVDRTADFVRKVGTAFEAEILQRNAGYLFFFVVVFCVH